MTSPFVVPAETIDRQRRASAPESSAWVSANAGSGKTWVLARRVIRLLLAGTPASRILCLTFTKAAAATMSNRVFAELGRWTLLDDEALRSAIAEVEGPAVDRGPRAVARLDRARRLFAEAIETPGGLKIQTIHAFCERILQQFPLEADLGGHFDILDERLERELVAAARDAELVSASRAPLGDPVADALAILLDTVGEFALAGALDAVIAARDDLRNALRAHGDLDGVIAAIRAALAVPDGERDARLVAEMLASPEFPAPVLAELIDTFAGSGRQDAAQAERLRRAVAPTVPANDRLAAWWSVFFTNADAPRATRSLATKAVCERHPDFLDRAARETARLQRLADARAALASATTTAALLRLGDRVVGRYERAKRARGALDFDDLVTRTADLLSRSDAAAWVQYKLDRGIDHILVDEAQDTSPRQWAIVHGLTEEFFAGEGARLGVRTVFAVGDEKQSIYSFQGAEPRRFSESRSTFAARARAVDRPFADVQLNLSFRSTDDVLAAVDRVFEDPALRARLLTDPSDYGTHAAARAGAPGLVEIWPMIVADKEVEPDDWAAPLDRATTAAPWMRLAARIADEIEHLLAPGFRLEGTGRPLGPRDIVVLVRKRGVFVDAINRVLKERGLAVAGHDRLRLTDHIAVADLMALGRTLLLPEDDLALASVLKCPLFDRSDDDLVDLACTDRREGESLTAALHRAADASPAWRAVASRLEDWRERARRLPPFELYARILAADGGRRRFVARLGSEAEDVLDEFLALAAAADRGPAPSLGRFLADLEADAPEIKRELDETRDELRVMTVHGAKGLEAAVVFLVDPGSGPVHAAHDPTLVRLAVPDSPPGAPPVPVWSRGSADPAVVVAARAAHRDAASAEYLRLLYVAMTRAADRLYVCGFAGVRGASPECWHARIAERLLPDAEEVTDAAGTVVAHRWRTGRGIPRPPEPPAPAVAAANPDLPAWIDRPPPVVPTILRATPSAHPDAPAAKGRGGPAAAAERAARRELERLRGTLAHRLLEVLPGLAVDRRRAAATRFLAARAAAWPEDARTGLLAEVESVLAAPDFAAVFAAGSRAEVPIVGRLVATDATPIEISGRIDRLAITADAVLLVDFKTDRRPPPVGAPPASHVEQLALYRVLLARLFPGRAIRCALLWTALQRLDEIAPVLLDAAARRLALS
ncbi:double-strand break repair helicase AddA [Siculibacillus lacustris]|uniref:double-strand break repair helicase AddA n=1 Tax=Siculibacillus lacustris TaxID=1549641 RepID=UPI0013F14F72|nr:double-strand break repair helicase AddA [Siculibacillus lacustris]